MQELPEPGSSFLPRIGNIYRNNDQIFMRKI